MSVSELNHPRSMKKIFMGVLLALLIAGGIFVFVAGNGAGSRNLVSQDIAAPPFPIGPPDQPILPPTVPPLPAPDTIPRLDPPAPMKPAPIR